jgi:hypothetical protein
LALDFHAAAGGSLCSGTRAGGLGGIDRSLAQLFAARLFLKLAYTFPLDRGVQQSTIGAMGFNRRKLEAERKAMIMGERTRYKLQWAKGGKAFYAFYGGTLSCMRCGAEPTATSGR